MASGSLTPDPGSVRLSPDPGSVQLTPDPGSVRPAAPLKGAANDIGRIARTFDQKVGGALQYGHKHPFEAFMDVAGAPMRAGQAALTNQNPLAAAFQPKMQPELEQRLRAPLEGGDLPIFGSGNIPAMLLRGTGALIGAAERGPLAGPEPGKKAARAALDTGLDVVSDPSTFISPELAWKTFARVAPSAAAKIAIPFKAGSTLAKSTFVGKALNPEAPIEGLTDYGKATTEAIVNKSRQGVAEASTNANRVIAQYADDIRKGAAPDAVRALAKNPDELPFGKNAKPRDVLRAIEEQLQQQSRKDMKKQLRMAGYLPQKVGEVQVVLKDPAKVFKNPNDIEAAQQGIKDFIKTFAPHEAGNPILKALRYTTMIGNKAFLAIPFPHGMNLLNLSFNKYGGLTTLKGIANAARVATGTVGKGKLATDIRELSGLGAHSQYRNIFDELGISRLANIPGTEGAAKAANRVVLIPLEKFSNMLQNKFLNPLETGLRTAGLNAERKAGVTGAEAARSIHRAFGTDPANALTRGAADIGTGFAKFHTQTVVGSGIQTMLRNPARITNLIKAQINFNKQMNPTGPQFSLTTPAFSFVRSMVDPMHYFYSITGPLGQLGNGYSDLSQAEKGKVAEAVSAAVGHYVPASQAGQVILELVTGSKGEAKEPATADIAPLFTGGYWSKP